MPFEVPKSVTIFLWYFGYAAAKRSPRAVTIESMYGLTPRLLSWARAKSRHRMKKLSWPSGGSIQFHVHEPTSSHVSRSAGSGTSVVTYSVLNHRAVGRWKHSGNVAKEATRPVA